ncbi:hypothetical protein K1718_24950 [Roseibium porphyridii]|uniref:DUF2946 domain-containing protein n=1 Tax=Roseibium porphyridii TaxID=2866279 RepID=A0ABY8F1N6_9HYPH|nr:DUF2946 family protein [Roseibium sp. KMA01]WFE89365.1 hypothetical protein K1718_24950 [Roseibium sp. KMA01]
MGTGLEIDLREERSIDGVERFRKTGPDSIKVIRTLLLLPFLFVALLPKGFMPAVQADGTFTVTLCTAEGLRTVTLDANGAEIPSDSDSDDDALKHCVFAVAGVFALLHACAGCWDAPRNSEQHVPFQTMVWVTRSSTGQHGARAPPRLV